MRKAILLAASMTIVALAPLQHGYTAGEARLDDILAAQPDEVQARYEYRHPKETLEFFGIERGMTVVEALPGGGWYTKILLPYLGSDGTVIGADYPMDMWPLFDFATAEFLDRRKTWTDSWTAGAEEWRGDDSADVSAFVLGSLPKSMHGTADAVLLIRAMHNLARFESEGSFLSAAIKDSYDVLKPGGIVGIVQHHARDDMPDSWADGSNGYLKKDFIIEQMQAAGFELVADSDLNANPKDRPTTDEYVWRLPPGYDGSEENPQLRAKVDEIGESNRMTLKFRKP